MDTSVTPGSESASIRSPNPDGPIFIHSLPRAASTWLGYKFGDLPTIGYRFEPFHENLIAGTQAELQQAYERLRYGKSLRHPIRPLHYHKDYNFQPGGGVALFEKRFCFENYYMEPDQTDEPLKAYLAGQIDEATEGNKRACIKSTKSALRARWLARNFPGTHLYIFRDPRLVDNSHFSYRGFSNPYIKDYGVIIGQNGQAPLFSELARWSGLDCFISESLEQDYRHYRGIQSHRKVGRYNRQYHFDCLCFFWSLALGVATRYADLIIDMDTLVDDHIRHETEVRIRELTGLRIDLSDYHVDARRIRRVLGRHQWTVSKEMIRIIQNALSHIAPKWDRAFAFPLSEATAETVGFLGGQQNSAPEQFFGSPGPDRKANLGIAYPHPGELFSR